MTVTKQGHVQQYSNVINIQYIVPIYIQLTVQRQVPSYCMVWYRTILLLCRTYKTITGTGTCTSAGIQQYKESTWNNLILIFITFWPLRNRRNIETCVCASESQINMLNIAQPRLHTHANKQTRRNRIPDSDKEYCCSVLITPLPSHLIMLSPFNTQRRTHNTGLTNNTLFLKKGL